MGDNKDKKTDEQESTYISEGIAYGICFGAAMDYYSIT